MQHKSSPWIILSLLTIGVFSLVSCWWESELNTSTNQPVVHKNVKKTNKNEATLEQKNNSNIIRVSLDNSFLSDIKDIFKYGEYRGIFKKNNIEFEGALYVKEEVPAKFKNNPPALIMHVWVFGTMFDEREKNDSVKWIGTIWRWTDWIGVTTFDKNNLSNIKTVWLTGSGNDINLLWTLMLKRFNINPDWKMFIDTQFDTDKFTALDTKKIDVTFLKWSSRALSEKKYTVFDPSGSKSFSPFRTMYATNPKGNHELTNRFLKAFNEIKQDIISNPIEFKKYIDIFGASVIKNDKDAYYRNIADSISNLDTTPNKDQIKDALWIYLKLKNISEDKLDIDSMIYTQ